MKRGYKPQEPLEKPSSRIDPAPPWETWRRKMITLRTVSKHSETRAISQREFIERICALQKQASTTENMAVMTAALWKMEKLSFDFSKARGPGHTLNESLLPVEVRPVAHTGMGVAAVEEGLFQAARIREIIDSFSHPDYKLFAYESIGAMLGLYERDAFGLTTRALGRMGLIPLARLRRPEPGIFIPFFSEEVRRLIAHGYGRMLYFKSSSVLGAVRAARRALFVEFAPCVRGIAFAFAMVNNSDLSAVLKAGDKVREHDWAGSFQDGLIYALEFWEWLAPGFLRSLRASDTLITFAREEVERNRSRGVLPAFSVTASMAAKPDG